ncbi:MAG: ATP-binding protein [Bdellovibrionales bacterium]|nr:ATP-binding protein [Bdellovibrionales bacterium]
MNYIPRLLSIELKRSAKQYPVTAVLGPRQSGKTTLAKKTFPRKKYISLEDLDNREFASTDPRGFLNTYSQGAIIDEAQRCPELLSYIQTLVDHKKQKGQFILTGSNQFLLEEKITQSLAGRVALLRLLPLSLQELKQAKKTIPVDDMIFRGFYPQLYSEDINTKRFFNNYIESYVNKDVRLIKNISNLSLFTTFLKLCANRTGQLLNLQSLANDCGITQNTVKSWISILENSFILKRIYPYYKNFNKSLVKTPKVYFYDTGLLCRLLSLQKIQDLVFHPLKGFLFENFIFTEIEKYFFNQGEKAPLYFWRDRKGYEIDFLIEERKLKAIEVKAGQTFSQNFLKNINYFSKNVFSPIKSYLIYSGKEKQIRNKTLVLPFLDLDQAIKK